MLRNKELKVSLMNHTFGLWGTLMYLPKGHQSVCPVCVREWVIFSHSLWSGPVGNWSGNSLELYPASLVSMIGSALRPSLHIISPMLCTALQCQYLLRVSCSCLSKIPVLWTASISVWSCTQSNGISNVAWRRNTTPYLCRSSQRFLKNPWVANLPKATKVCEKIMPPRPTSTWNTWYAWWSILPNMLPVSQCDCRRWIFLLSASMFGFGRASPWYQRGSNILLSDIPVDTTGG